MSTDTDSVSSSTVTSEMDKNLVSVPLSLLKSLESRVYALEHQNQMPAVPLGGSEQPSQSGVININDINSRSLRSLQSQSQSQMTQQYNSRANYWINHYDPSLLSDTNRILALEEYLTSLATEFYQLRSGLDIGYTIIMSMIVFFMQAGFSLIEVASCKIRSAMMILLKNVTDACVSVTVWWIIGFAVAFPYRNFDYDSETSDDDTTFDFSNFWDMMMIGEAKLRGPQGYNTSWNPNNSWSSLPDQSNSDSNDLILDSQQWLGLTNLQNSISNLGNNNIDSEQTDTIENRKAQLAQFGTRISEAQHYASNVSMHNGVHVSFFFQAVFCATATTIVSGGLAERCKLGGYVLFSIIMTSIIYPFVVRLTWGGGFLYQIGFRDFAGSAVVHLTGGVAAFCGAYCVGPRKGRFPELSSKNVAFGDDDLTSTTLSQISVQEQISIQRNQLSSIMGGRSTGAGGGGGGSANNNEQDNVVNNNIIGQQQQQISDSNPMNTTQVQGRQIIGKQAVKQIESQQQSKLAERESTNLNHQFDTPPNRFNRVISYDSQKSQDEGQQQQLQGLQQQNQIQNQTLISTQIQDNKSQTDNYSQSELPISEKKSSQGESHDVSVQLTPIQPIMLPGTTNMGQQSDQSQSHTVDTTNNQYNSTVTNNNNDNNNNNMFNSQSITPITQQSENDSSKKKSYRPIQNKRDLQRELVAEMDSSKYKSSISKDMSDVTPIVLSSQFNLQNEHQYQQSYSQQVYSAGNQMIQNLYQGPPMANLNSSSSNQNLILNTNVIGQTQAAAIPQPSNNNINNNIDIAIQDLTHSISNLQQVQEDLDSNSNITPIDPQQAAQIKQVQTLATISLLDNVANNPQVLESTQNEQYNINQAVLLGQNQMQNQNQMNNQQLSQNTTNNAAASVTQSDATQKSTSSSQTGKVSGSGGGQPSTLQQYQDPRFNVQVLSYVDVNNLAGNLQENLNVTVVQPVKQKIGGLLRSMGVSGPGSSHDSNVISVQQYQQQAANLLNSISRIHTNSKGSYPSPQQYNQTNSLVEGGIAIERQRTGTENLILSRQQTNNNNVQKIRSITNNSNQLNVQNLNSAADIIQRISGSSPPLSVLQRQVTSDSAEDRKGQDSNDVKKVNTGDDDNFNNLLTVAANRDHMIAGIIDNDIGKGPGGPDQIESDESMVSILTYDQNNSKAQPMIMITSDHQQQEHLSNLTNSQTNDINSKDNYNGTNQISVPTSRLENSDNLQGSIMMQYQIPHSEVIVPFNETQAEREKRLQQYQSQTQQSQTVSTLLNDKNGILLQQNVKQNRGIANGARRPTRNTRSLLNNIKSTLKFEESNQPSSIYTSSTPTSDNSTNSSLSLSPQQLQQYRKPQPGYRTQNAVNNITQQYDEILDALSLLNMALGVFILWFCWIAFNAGSTRGVSSPEKAVSASRAALNTILAGASGGLVAMLIAMLLSQSRKWDGGAVTNGILSGCAAITASCDNVEPKSAVILGSLGGLGMLITTLVLERNRIDDPVGVTGVHLSGGLIGALGKGLFDLDQGWISGRGSSDSSSDNRSSNGFTDLLGPQIVGIFVIVLWTYSTSYCVFTILIKRNMMIYDWKKVHDNQMVTAPEEGTMADFNYESYKRILKSMLEQVSESRRLSRGSNQIQPGPAGHGGQQQSQSQSQIQQQNGQKFIDSSDSSRKGNNANATPHNVKHNAPDLSAEDYDQIKQNMQILMQELNQQENPSMNKDSPSAPSSSRRNSINGDHYNTGPGPNQQQNVDNDNHNGITNGNDHRQQALKDLDLNSSTKLRQRSSKVADNDSIRQSMKTSLKSTQKQQYQYQYSYAQVSDEFINCVADNLKDSELSLTSSKRVKKSSNKKKSIPSTPAQNLNSPQSQLSDQTQDLIELNNKDTQNKDLDTNKSNIPGTIIADSEDVNNNVNDDLIQNNNDITNTEHGNADVNGNDVVTRGNRLI